MDAAVQGQGFYSQISCVGEQHRQDCCEMQGVLPRDGSDRDRLIYSDTGYRTTIYI